MYVHIYIYIYIYIYTSPARRRHPSGPRTWLGRPLRYSSTSTIYFNKAIHLQHFCIYPHQQSSLTKQSIYANIHFDIRQAPNGCDHTGLGRRRLREPRRGELGEGRPSPPSPPPRPPADILIIIYDGMCRCKSDYI